MSVPDLVSQTKSGKMPNHAAGIKGAQRAVDTALTPKKLRLQRPE
jgi:hypothetical protein